MAFGQWIQNQSWPDVYEAGNVHEKAQIFQNILLESYNKYFPVKEHKVCSEDKAWISKNLKKLDRCRKREFLKHKQSEKWTNLNEKFLKQSKEEKAKYYENMMSDLKTSDPGKWYSKLKTDRDISWRMH